MASVAFHHLAPHKRLSLREKTNKIHPSLSCLFKKKKVPDNCGNRTQIILLQKHESGESALLPAAGGGV